MLRFAAIVIAVLLFPLALLAQPDAAPTMEDAPGLLAVVIDSFRDGNVPLAVGSLAVLISLVIGVVNKILMSVDGIPDERRKTILRWSVAAAGMLTAFGLALIGGVGWLNAAIAGLVTCAAAVGFWKLVLERIAKFFAAQPPVDGIQ